MANSEAERTPESALVRTAEPVVRDVDRATLSRCLEAIASGDHRALRELIERTQPRLRAIALRMLGDAGEAEEVLQDVYLTVWAKAGRYDPGRAHAMAWLTVLTRNRGLDKLRQRTSRSQLNALVADSPTPPDAVDERNGEIDERLDRIAATLEALEPGTRDAIKAAFFEGHTYEALARISNVPLGTMKSRIRRGLLALRSALRL